jgi:hypothetical protein
MVTPHVPRLGIFSKRLFAYIHENKFLVILVFDAGKRDYGGFAKSCPKKI